MRFRKGMTELQKRTNKQKGKEEKNRNPNSLSLSALQCKPWKQKLHSNYILKTQNVKPTTLSAVLPREQRHSSHKCQTQLWESLRH